MASRVNGATTDHAAAITSAAKSEQEQDSKKNGTYKWTHSIGSRRATERVVTYSDALTFFSDMVHTVFPNTADMEPRKASPAKSTAAASRATPPKASKSCKSASATKGSLRTKKTKISAAKSASPAKSPAPAPSKLPLSSKSFSAKPHGKSSPKSPKPPKTTGKASSPARSKASSGKTTLQTEKSTSKSSVSGPIDGTPVSKAGGVKKRKGSGSGNNGESAAPSPAKKKKPSLCERGMQADTLSLPSLVDTKMDILACKSAAPSALSDQGRDLTADLCEVSPQTVDANSKPSRKKKTADSRIFVAEKLKKLLAKVEAKESASGKKKKSSGPDKKSQSPGSNGVSGGAVGKGKKQKSDAKAKGPDKVKSEQNDSEAKKNNANGNGANECDSNKTVLTAKAGEAEPMDKKESAKGDDHSVDVENKCKNKKSTKKKVTEEPPSLLSFIKPKRQASLFACAMMDILFEKPEVSPKKTVGEKSPYSKSSTAPSAKSTSASCGSGKTPSPGDVDLEKVKKAKKKLQFEKASVRDKPAGKKPREETQPKEGKSQKGKKSVLQDKKSQKAREEKDKVKKSDGGKEEKKKEEKKEKKEKKKKAKGKEVVKKVAKGKVTKRRCQKRMASLNAIALIQAERESLQVVSERAARTDRYCLAWNRSKPRADRSPHRHARWLDGLGVGSCDMCGSGNGAATSGNGTGSSLLSGNNCSSKKDLSPHDPFSIDTAEVSVLAPPTLSLKLPLTPHPSTLAGLQESRVLQLPAAVPLSPASAALILQQPPMAATVGTMEKEAGGEERPSSVVDVVTTTHTPHVDLVASPSHHSAIIDVVGPLLPAPNLAVSHLPAAAPLPSHGPPVKVLGAAFGNFGQLFGPHHPGAPCVGVGVGVGPCPGYTTYSHVTTSASYQSFTLSAMPTLPLVTGPFRPSAFSVPGYNIPYSYFPGAPYFQPAPSALLQPTLPGPCMLPHHLSIKVPHGQVKVLIHNPDTPQNFAAFSEHRSPAKGDLHPDSLLIAKLSNDNNNNHHHHHGSIRSGNSLPRVSNCSNHSINQKKVSVERSPAGKAEVKRSEGAGDDGRRIVNGGDCGSKQAKNTDSNNKGKKVAGGEQARKKDGEDRKTEGRPAVTKAGKEPKGAQPKLASKKKAGKKPKAGEKGGGEEEPEKVEAISEHGWVWVGEPEMQKVVKVEVDLPAEERLCYKAIRHTTHNDVIQVRDCVLLRSGVNRCDIPYVAKVSKLWEHPKTKEMMMSLLWYYQPEHTEAGRQPEDLDNEVFASRHRDENSVACIDDKCFVLTYEQYCRYQAEMRRVDHNIVPRNRIVPDPDPKDPEIQLPQREFPDEEVDPANIFVCRKVYDFRCKRILKNPL